MSIFIISIVLVWLKIKLMTTCQAFLAFAAAKAWVIFIY